LKDPSKYMKHVRVKKNSQSNKKRKTAKDPIKNFKIAIISDRLTNWGGAELTVKVLTEMFPHAPVYTSVYDKTFLAQHFPKTKVISSIVQHFPFEKQLRKEYTIFYPFAFRLFDMKKYDLVISVSSGFAKFVRTKGITKHIFMCLTPPVFLWLEERRSLKVNKRMTYTFLYEKLLKKPLHAIFKRMDLRAAKEADIILANSKTVAKRIESIYGRKAEVLYPPIEVEKIPFNKDISKREKWFFYFGRIEIYKGVELAIRACVDLKRPLKILGTGYDEERLKGIVQELNAKGIVKFLGFRDDKEKFELLKRCKAFLYPVRDEDFGIVPIEANAAGAPVIAHRSGGSLETLSERNPQTAVYFEKYDWQGLRDAILEFDKIDFNPDNCRKHAVQFSRELFEYKVITLVKDVLRNK